MKVVAWMSPVHHLTTIPLEQLDDVDIQASNERETL
jgi:hypothetical protein